jgi:hypothetical protein
LHAEHFILIDKDKRILSYTMGPWL